MKLLLITSLAFMSTICVAKFTMEDLSLGAALNKYEYKRIGNEKEIEWGVDIGNANSEKYLFNFNYSNNYRRFDNIYSLVGIKTTSQFMELDFAVNKILGRMGLISEMDFKQEKRNGIYTTKYEITGFPLGVKYDFYQSENVKNISLNYIPHYNYFERYEPTADFSGLSTGVKKIISRAIHHKASLVTEFSFFDDTFEISNTLIYIHIDPIGVEVDDGQSNNRIFSNEFQLDYNITEYVSIGLRHFIERDNRRREIDALPSTNTEESINFRIHWN